MREPAPHPVSEESKTVYGKDGFDIFDLKRIEQDRRLLLAGVGRHEEFIKGPDDRVGYIWALKRMAGLRCAEKFCPWSYRAQGSVSFKAIHLPPSNS